MRLGPFDVEAQGRAEAIYSTNVEQERADEADGAERKDYYGVLGLDMTASTTVTPETDLNLDTGIAVERHVNRPDLDNADNPFGRAHLNSETKLGRYTLLGELYYERLSESQDSDRVVRGSRKKRDPHDIKGYLATIQWAYEGLKLEGSYAYDSERHDLEEFQDGDEDKTTIDFLADYEMTRRISLSYDYDQELTETPEDPDDWEGWEVTQRAEAGFKIMEIPEVEIGGGFASEDDQDVKGTWKPVYFIRASYDQDINEVLSADVYVDYEHDNDANGDDIATTYGAQIEHQISRTASQSFSAAREPYDTFGSTEETDKTTYNYRFEKSDLFIYNLNLSASVEYSIEKPMGHDAGEPTEKIWTYNVKLDHTRQLTRNLSRSLSYMYDREDSNLEEELLEEHRVTLSFIRDF